MADKIAILGGTFNPIHNGHITMATYALNECGLSKVIFLPNGNPPHKSGCDMLSPDIRYKMVTLALENYDSFFVSDYEVKKEKPSYTIDSLPYLKKTYGNDIYFIIGADSLYSLHSWKNFEELIQQCSFIVADRNVENSESVHNICESLRKHGTDIIELSMPCIDITSTQIREMIKCGRDVRELIPLSVYEYIKLHNVYQPYMEGNNDY